MATDLADLVAVLVPAVEETERPLAARGDQAAAVGQLDVVLDEGGRAQRRQLPVNHRNDAKAAAALHATAEHEAVARLEDVERELHAREEDHVQDK